MKKKLIVLLCCGLIMTSVFSTPVLASSSELKEETVDTLSEHGYNIVDTSGIKEFVEVDSIEEVEEYLDEIDEIDTDYEAYMPAKNRNPLLRADVNDTYTFSWWNPFSGFDGLTLYCFSNVGLQYKYRFVSGKPQFVSAGKVTSYLSGISATTWSQKTYSTNIVKTYNTRDTCKIVVNGAYRIGISVGGTLIGATRNATWKCSLRIYS